MMSDDVLTRLLAFVSREFADGSSIEPSQQLMPDLVDSLGIFVLAEFIQHEFEVSLDDLDLNAENLATTRALSDLVSSKLEPGEEAIRA